MAVSTAFGVGWTGDPLRAGAGLDLEPGLGGTGGGTLGAWTGAGVVEDFNDFAGTAEAGFFAGAEALGVVVDFRAGLAVGAAVFKVVAVGAAAAGFWALLKGVFSAGCCFAIALADDAGVAFAFLEEVFVLSATEATEDLAEAGEGAAVAVPAGVVELAGLVATGLPNLAVGLEFPLTDDGLVFAIR